MNKEWNNNEFDIYGTKETTETIEIEKKNKNTRIGKEKL